MYEKIDYLSILFKN